METVVYGRLAGQEMARFVKRGKKNYRMDSVHEGRARKRIETLLSNPMRVRPHVVRAKLGEAMMRFSGVFRDKKGLEAGLRASNALGVEDKSPYFNTDLVEALEAQNLVTFSQTILQGALARTESRGSHYRTDHPARNDKRWLKHTLAKQGPRGTRIFYKNVVIKGYKPEARHY